MGQPDVAPVLHPAQTKGYYIAWLYHILGIVRVAAGLKMLRILAITTEIA